MGISDLICQQILNKVWFSPSVEFQLQNNKKVLYLFIYFIYLFTYVSFLLFFIPLSFRLSDTETEHTQMGSDCGVFNDILPRQHLVKCVVKP